MNVLTLDGPYDDKRWNECRQMSARGEYEQIMNTHQDKSTGLCRVPSWSPPVDMELRLPFAARVYTFAHQQAEWPPGSLQC